MRASLLYLISLILVFSQLLETNWKFCSIMFCTDESQPLAFIYLSFQQPFIKCPRYSGALGDTGECYRQRASLMALLFWG